MEKEKCKNITAVKKITSGVTAMIAMTAGIVMMPFIANASSENIQNSFGGGYKDTADEYIVDAYGNDNEISEQTDDTGGVYDFKDNKTTGTVTVTKVWDDGLTNDEREIPDIKISTKKPSKSTLGYTVTFHGNAENRLLFDNGSDVNEVVINSSGQIESGNYKIAGGALFAGWYSDGKYTNRVEVSNDGVPQMTLTGDLDLWAKQKTTEIKGYNYSLYTGNGFNKSIPSTVTEVIFTDEIKPASAEIIDVDADGDGGIVAWTENDGTVMKVSTQIEGMKIQAAKNSAFMFSYRTKLTNIDFSMLDTSKVTRINEMFYNCSGLTSLDLTPLNTSNVTDMSEMFSGCRGLTSLDLTPLDTSNVTNMGRMFCGCSGLTSLNLMLLNTSKVTDMESMFVGCSGLTSLDLTPLNTSKVTDMNFMFSGCRGLTSLDLTPLDTSKVESMVSMFSNCSGLTSLDLTSLDTSKVRNMKSMFDGCSSLTTLITGSKFKFVDTDYKLSGTWRNTAGETFTEGTFPSNVADTYTKIS